MTTTATAPETTANPIDGAVEKLRGAMTSEYTPIWEVSDFLLDAASTLSSDPLAVAEIHRIHTELAPSAQRSVVTTVDAAKIIDQVRNIAATAA